MPERRFETEAAVAAFLRDRLTAAPSRAPGHVDALLASPAFVQTLVERVVLPPPPDAAPAMSRRFRWVIQDDDLQLAESVIDCVETAIASGGALLLGSVDGSAWAALTGISATLIKLLRRASARGVVLEPRTFAVLLVLRNEGPLTVDALCFRLQASDPTWRRAEVESRLARLGSIAMKDGTATALVAQDADDDAWRTVGV